MQFFKLYWLINLFISSKLSDSNHSKSEMWVFSNNSNLCLKFRCVACIIKLSEAFFKVAVRCRIDKENLKRHWTLNKPCESLQHETRKTFAAAWNIFWDVADVFLSPAKERKKYLCFSLWKRLWGFERNFIL